jgi:hypothetical protein
MRNRLFRILDPLFRTKGRTIVITLLLTFFAASTIYCANNYWYYNSIATIAENNNEHYKQTIKLFVDLSREEELQTSLKRVLQEYINSANGKIRIQYTVRNNLLWDISNRYYVDPERTQITDTAIIRDNSRHDSYIEYSFQRGVRPPFTNGLVRAWTFSVGDLVTKGLNNYRKYYLYQRSLPFWTYFAILLVFIYFVGVVIRSIYDHNKWLHSINQEREKTINELKGQLNNIEERFNHTKSRLNNTDSEIKDKEQYISNLAESSNKNIEVLLTELKELKQQRDKDHELLRETKNKLDNMDTREADISNFNIDDLKAQQNEVIVKLTNAESQIKEKDELIQKLTTEKANDIKSLKSELGSLISEREEIEADYNNLLSDKKLYEQQLSESNELYNMAVAELNEKDLKVKDLVRIIDNLKNASTLNIENRKEYKEIISHLDKWVRKSRNNAEYKLSDHGTKGYVSKQMDLLTSEFISTYFITVYNGAYNSYHRKAIIPELIFTPFENGDKKGTLKIVLEDDTGCSIDMDFMLKKNAPEKYVSFLMALLVKCHHNRLFADYNIQINS